MRARWTVAASTLAMITIAVPAQACIVSVEIDLADIQYADVVVVGRIRNYEIVLDLAEREERRGWLAESPDMPADERRRLESQTSFMSDYARFEIAVDEVLFGNVPNSITVTWDNSTFGEPETMPSGQVLIALRDPDSGSPPLRGPSATILPNPEPRSLTVLQAPCSREFIFDSGSEQAGAIRRILARRPRQANVR